MFCIGINDNLRFPKNIEPSICLFFDKKYSYATVSFHEWKFTGHKLTIQDKTNHLSKGVEVCWFKFKFPLENIIWSGHLTLFLTNIIKKDYCWIGRVLKWPFYVSVKKLSFAKLLILVLGICIFLWKGLNLAFLQCKLICLSQKNKTSFNIKAF